MRDQAQPLQLWLEPMDGDAPAAIEIVVKVLTWLPWLIVLGGVALMWTAHRFASRAIRVTAVVVDLNEERIPARRPSQKPTVLQRPLFEYRGADGMPHRAEAFAPSTDYRLSRGDGCEILLDPDMPEIARLKSSAIYAPGVILIAIGLGFVLITRILPG